MNEIMQTLTLEHKGLAKLLDLLKGNLKALKEGESVDFNLLDEVIRYIENHASHYHHPKEDVVYHYITDNGLDTSGDFEKVIEEHQTLATNTQKLREALDGILMDTVVPKTTLIDLLDQFITAEIDHINHEESQIFPAINEILSDKDWEKVSVTLPEKREDPLFGKQVKAEYQDLYQRLSESA